MNAPTPVPQVRMTVPEFLDWAAAQPSGRYELAAGSLVPMSPERNRHLMAKGAAFRALSAAVDAAGLDCTVLPDGATVVIDEETAREPDAAVQCGPAPDPDSLVLDAPLIVVEVTSPTSVRTDEDLKLVEYFSVPSVRHYVLVHPKQGAIVHHRRDGGEIRTRILRDGNLELTPPGLSIPVRELLGPVSERGAR